MATVVDYDRVLGLLADEFAAVSELCRDLDDAQCATSTCLPGWTVKDVVSHLAGTERMLEGENPPRVDVSHLTHLKNDIARANEVWIEADRPRPGAEVLAVFDAVTERRLGALRAMSQADFDMPSWTPAGPDETYGRFMRIRHYDCFLHDNDIRDALGFDDHDDEAHMRLALEEPAAALGYIVGRRASMPTGSRIRISLTGTVAQTYDVAVDGRAEVVERLDGPPTAGIELPAMLFLRLTGGRQDPEPHVGKDIVLHGDVELATRLATHLAYTI